MMPRKFTILFILSLTVLSSNVAAQKQIEISSVDQFIEAVKNLKSGTTLSLLPGTYDFKERIEITVAATEKNPILISAKESGKVKLIGNSWFALKNASFITIEGFEFISNDGPAVELLGCNNIRVTNNVFHLKETKRSSWILIGDEKSAVKNSSHHNRIDHNLFENKKELGNFITIEGTMQPEFQVSQNDLIDNNHFRNIGPRAENVLEAIRIGSSHVSLSSGFTIIEKNLFERCDGDPEIVSIKSSDDIVRYNTFRECLGVLSLRHGNRCTIDGNYFLGNGRTGEFIDSTKRKWVLGTGGVRFYGDNMKVINNYFEGLTGEKWDGSLALTNGDADYGMGLSLTKHYRPRYCLIAFNTFINNKSNIEIGYDGGGFQNNWWRMPPSEITVANNIVVGSNGKLIDVMTKPLFTSWSGNIVYPKGKAIVGGKFVSTELKVMDPKLIKEGEVYKLSQTNSLRGKAQGQFPVVVFDIDGQWRGEDKDPGCDQFTISDAINKPLTKNDVGTTWYKGN